MNLCLAKFQVIWHLILFTLGKKTNSFEKHNDLYFNQIGPEDYFHAVFNKMIQYFLLLKRWILVAFLHFNSLSLLSFEIESHIWLEMPLWWWFKTAIKWNGVGSKAGTTFSFIVPFYSLTVNIWIKDPIGTGWCASKSTTILEKTKT